MEADLITVFAAHGDGGERGTGPIIGVFRNSASAQEYAKGKGWYGADGIVESTSAIVFEDGSCYLVMVSSSSKTPTCFDLDLLQKNHDEQIKANALQKLSVEERRVLGIK